MSTQALAKVMTRVRLSREGNAKRILFICSAGLLRSPTAAIIGHQQFGWNARSAGIEDFALINVTDALLGWADCIICMTDDHKVKLLSQFSHLDIQPDTVEVLDIPDDYSWMDDTLVAILRDKLRD